MSVRQATLSEAEAGSGWHALLARVGLVAKGLSYGLVGVLAVQVALGDGGKATSRQGALQLLAQHAPGKALLAALAFGFAAYAVWRFVQAVVEDDGEEKKKWAKRGGYAGRGVIYAGLTFSAVKILLGSGGGQSQNGKAHQTTATVLSWPGAP